MLDLDCCPACGTWRVASRRHQCGKPQECPGHERGGTDAPCCDRAGEYNGYGSDGPYLFHCPKGCGCHD